MGVYWTLVCDRAREYVEPHALEGQGAKISEITLPRSRFGALALHCLYERWSGKPVRLVSEFEAPDTYRDVSHQAIEEFNRDFGDVEPIDADPDYQSDDEEEDTPPPPIVREKDVRVFFTGRVEPGGCVELLAERALARRDNDFAEIAIKEASDGFRLQQVNETLTGFWGAAMCLVRQISDSAEDVDRGVLPGWIVVPVGRKLSEPIRCSPDMVRVFQVGKEPCEFCLELRGQSLLSASSSFLSETPERDS